MKPTVLSDLEMRVACGEDVRTQFRPQGVTTRVLAEDLVAFANTEGGILFIGIASDGSILGVGDVEKVMKRVDSVARSNCQPPILVRPQSAQLGDGKTVVVVDVARGEARPYRTDRGVVLVRVDSGRRPATTDDLRRILQPARYRYFDQSLVYRSSLSFIDDKATRDLVASASAAGMDVGDLSSKTLLDYWHLAEETGSGRYLTVTGVLFLARRPQDFLPYAYGTALRIPGTDISGEPSVRELVVGRPKEMVESAMEFLRTYLLDPDGAAGADSEIPEAALYEIVVNSIAHRDYTIAGSFRIIVFDDRVQIRSPGFPPDTVTLEALRAGVHVLRNPTIYNMLLKVGLVTEAGRGIPKAIRLVREATGVEPKFFMEKHEFVVELLRKKKD